MATTLTIISGQTSFTAQGWTILPSPGTAVPDNLAQAIISAAVTAGVVLSSSAGTGVVTVPSRRFSRDGVGPPQSGEGLWLLGDEIVDSAASEWECTAPGDPGTWLAVASGTYASPGSVLSDVTSVRTAAGALTVGMHNPVDATTAGVSVSIPSLSTAGQRISIEKTDGSLNAVTVTLNLRGTPASTLTLVWKNETLELVSKADGSWWPTAGHKTKASIDAEISAIGNGTFAPIASGTTTGLHKNTPSSTYGDWFTFGNGPNSNGGANTGTPAEGWGPFVVYQKFGDFTGGTNANVTHTTQAGYVIGSYWGPTVDDSAQAFSAAVLLKNTGTGFTQGKKVVAFEADVQIEGANTVTGGSTYLLGQGTRLVLNDTSNADLGYGVKVSAATGNNGINSASGTLGTWQGFRDDAYNPAGTSRAVNESIHALNRITSEQSFWLFRPNFTGFAQMDLAGSDDSNAALFRIQQPSGASRNVADGSIANGSRKLTSATLNPTAADIGKTITVSGAGASGVTLTAKVLNYLPDGTTVLNTAASTTVTGATVVVTETDLVGLRITQGTSSVQRPIEIYDNTALNVAGVARTGLIYSRSQIVAWNSSNAQVCALNPQGSVQPGTPTGLGGKIYSGSGAPGSITNSAAGDFYLRTDTPSTANQRIYVATAANTWTAIL